MPVKIAWARMVLTLKGKGKYRGIGLVEVLWKFCAVVVNCCLKMIVVLHDALHGFRTLRGTATSTATLEAKLSQKLAGIAYDNIFQVLLYVRKAYNLLDRERCLELLREYGLGPNLAFSLRTTGGDIGSYLK